MCTVFAARHVRSRLSGIATITGGIRAPGKAAARVKNPCFRGSITVDEPPRVASGKVSCNTGQPQPLRAHVVVASPGDCASNPSSLVG